jgi:hypothetical protein
MSSGERMSKTAYAILFAIFFAAAGYAFWPQPEAVVRPLVTGSQPTSFTLRCAGLEQEVRDKQVRLKGLDRPLDETAGVGPWGIFSAVTVLPGKTVENVGDAQLAAYGLGSDREFVGGDVHVRWGEKDGSGYLWDGPTKRLSLLPPGMVAAIDKAAGRLDDRKLLSIAATYVRVEVDGLVLVRSEAGNWLSSLAPQRPPFDQRIGRIMALLTALTLDDLDGLATNLMPVAGRILLTPDAKAPDQTPLAITLFQAGDEGVIKAGALPAQRLAPVALAEWLAALAALRRDPLLVVDQALRRDDIVFVRVLDGPLERFRLTRREKVYESDDYAWDLVWPGGRDDAAPDAIPRILTLLDTLEVTLVEAVDGLAQRSPTALSIEVHHGRKDQERVLIAAIDGNRALTASHAGLLMDAAIRRGALRLERFLDARLIRRDTTRIAKIQRIDTTQIPQFQEVATRSDGGGWTRSFPAATPPPVIDAGAVDRLVRVLAGATLEDVGFPSAEDRAILTAPEIALDLRFAPNTSAKQAHADTDLDETATQDVGWALVEREGKWRGIDRDALLAFTLDAGVVEEIRRPFTVGALYPVVASLVTRAEIRSDTGSVVLVREGAGWSVAVDGGESRPADALAVRRWFRALGGLRAERIDARAVAFPAARVEASVVCTMPGLAGGNELVTLQIGRREDGRTRVVHVASDQLASRFPAGRAVPAEVDFDALVPGVAAFAP